MKFSISRRESCFRTYTVEADDLAEACAKLEVGQATLADEDEHRAEENPSGWLINDENASYANFKSPCMYRLQKGANYGEREKICTLSALYNKIAERVKALTAGKAA